ncbi:MAG: Ohr family peroxiredoxin [Nibricoccus sp.]
MKQQKQNSIDRPATGIATDPSASIGGTPNLPSGTKIVHTSEMLSQGGRQGMVEAPNGALTVELGEKGEDPVTPETLFAGAYAACFHGALLGAATRAHLMIPGSTVIGRVALLENEQGGWRLGVKLRASLPGIDRHQAEKLMHQAHQTCPYSQATRGNIEVVLALD